MDWTASIDIYCERTSSAFWAEPINAWTNLAFPIAALWAARTAKRLGAVQPEIWALIWLAALVGVGSFLFHTFANVWSEYADTIPIWTFVAATVFVALGRVAGLHPAPWLGVLLVILVVVIVLFLTATDPAAQDATTEDALNGSGQYAPALVALAGFAVFAWYRNLASRNLFAGAALAFFLALAFRTVDLHLCPSFSLGTHFLWHLLIGLTVGLVLQIVVRAAARPRVGRQ